jgi:hypothetical protein
MNDLVRYKIIHPSMAKVERPISDIEREKVIEIRINEMAKSNRLNHLLDSEKCLVMLSEAPTQHIFNWATRTYKNSNGPIKTMVQHGYHDDKVWESLFFQLLISMLIMFEKEIKISKLSYPFNLNRFKKVCSDHK